MKSQYLHPSKNKGFTLLELLIAIVILGILSTLVVFTYVKRADEARITEALGDMNRLAEAEQQAAVDTGFYCQLYWLDNPATTNTTTMPTNLWGGFITPSGPNEGTVIVDMQVVWSRIKPVPSNPNRWRGPYLDFKKRVEWLDAERNAPIDPWDSRYVFFTPKGEVDPEAGDVKPFPSAALTFDRYTIFSPGPDKVAETADDLIVQF